MNFQGLGKIEHYQFYLDVAIRRSQKAVAELRANVKLKTTNKLNKSKDMELLRIAIIERELSASLRHIIKAFPGLDSLDEFYKQLIMLKLDYGQIKKSLGSLQWGINKHAEFRKFYEVKIKHVTALPHINMYTRQYLGRASSIMKQLKQHLAYLEEARKIMQQFPSIKTGLYTVALCGYPNVGKSTLLSKLTDSKPEIKSYAFTTKQLNVGYMKTQYKRIQLIDTPGALDRPLEKMNMIELQASLVLKYVAEMALYIFDPTLGCGYSIEDQLEQLRKLKRKYTNLTFFSIINKTDAATPEQIDEVKKSLKEEPLLISAEKSINLESVRELISKESEK